MTKKRKTAKQGLCRYKLMRGVDLTHRYNRKNRLSRLENMYVDYEGGGDCIESIPGFRILYSFKKKIHSIFVLDGIVFVHAGTGLYRFMEKERNNLCALTPLYSLPDRKCVALKSSTAVYIIADGFILITNSDGKILRVDVSEDISACTVGTVFDGRLFLSGNKNAPERVYYSSFYHSDSPTFSPNCYFDMGKKVNSLICAKEKLWVFTDNGIYSYKSTEESYEPEEAVGGISAKGGICFLDRILFISEQGVFDTDETKCLSSEISPSLLRKESDSTILKSWQGYLAVCREGEIFLADPSNRTGENTDGYDWYYLSGIGTYTNDRRVYRYSTKAEDGFAIHSIPDSKANATVMSLINEDGKSIYYTEEDGVRYTLYPTEEFIGGDFSPAKEFESSGNLLYFATDSGDICIFNNDMRGIAPPYIRNAEDFSEEEYKKLYSGKIHPYYYSFASHSAEYIIETKNDNLDLPCTKKNTLHRSLTLECKNFGRSSMNVMVECDGNEAVKFPINMLSPDFSDADFNVCHITPEERVIFKLPEHRCGWISKQISIYGNEFCSPIGIYSISYIYKIRRQ